MSTFDGIIDEFPNIRIDYFRNQPGKTPPQACFLSHVHSDHLQGLETLKMPFVYCSAATKKILLQMEKHPHRINFAKGILEARRQTYKHLKLVLRPLPMETPVELELGPKSRIRVTLFDANHCPGAVMFLIEGGDKAILYTGDIRAESWWVNSITRNPILLPYSCRMRRLDCVYLDTTFASHDDIYKDFPSKAEGIQELLNKIDKSPKNSIFYFRSWTLGYEDVWVALSNFLDMSIHVDDYQLRIFKSLADGTTRTDRGACLAGFEFGNQYQLGCLTDNASASIHSCEPGTECHDRIKKQKNVVWISPIISRLKDGTEVAELGAGGGGGDLHPLAQLEMVDEAALKALQTLCASSAKHEEALVRLGAAFAEARSRGDLSINLDDIGLDQFEELTLKDFVHLVSSNSKVSNRTNDLPHDLQRIIHFPYSRHSSYSELRQFVSAFQPKDVCPCTVDIEKWSEEISMRSLFGDICSEANFRYDEEVRARVHERRASQQQVKTIKRKRGEGSRASQSSDVPKSQSTEEVFKSARTSIREDNEAMPTSPEHKESSVIVIPSQVRRIHEAIAERFDQDIRKPEQTTRITYSASTADKYPGVLSSLDKDTPSLSFSPIASLSPSALLPDNSDLPSQLASTPNQRKRRRTRKSRLQPNSSSNSQPTSIGDTDSDHDNDPARVARHDTHRVQSRKRAYHAATTALNLADHTAWHDLRLRSTGWKGHTEIETLL